MFVFLSPFCYTAYIKHNDMERPSRDSQEQRALSPSALEPKNLTPDFVRYLDVIVGNLIALGGFGKIEIEMAYGKPLTTWFTVRHKAGHEFEME